ncbi:MAG: hypothetical protein WBO08_05460 [Mycobacterium sp.]|nr:hypothetical protein [Mycobacterium sp.]
MPYATDDGAGRLYRGTDFVEAVAENNTAGAYFVGARDGSAVEATPDVRRLRAACKSSTVSTILMVGHVTEIAGFSPQVSGYHGYHCTM